jgi:putative ABC transport system permease protein
LNTLARLKPGVTLAQARADLDGLALASSDGQPHHAIVTRLDEDIVKDARRTLLILLGAVAFVLLVACANVAILQLARSMTRNTEMAVRLAMGAGRWRVIRQLLVESGMLALAGGLMGVFLAWCSVGSLVKLGASEIPRANEIGINFWVLGFTLVASLFAGVLFGIVPAVRTSTPSLSLCLKEGGAAAGGSRRQDQALGMLVGGEIALALTLLVGAGLMINTLWRLLHANPGFATDNLLTMEVDLPWRKYHHARAEEFRRSVLERVTSLHGVEAAAFANTIPMGGGETQSGFFPNGKVLGPESPGAPCQLRIISPDYFWTMRIPLLEGRFFTNEDIDGKPRVVIVNDTLARRYFGGRALGQHISQGPSEPLIEIVGVTADIRFSKLSSEPLPTVYYPFAQEMQGWHMLTVRTSRDPAKMVTDIRAAIHGLDPDVPVGDVMTMEQRVSQSLGTSRLLLLLLSSFAGVALILAGVGTYSAMSYSVTRRTHEIGIRMALGARKEDVVKTILGQGTLRTVAGVGIGLAGSLAVTRVLSNFLYGVTPTDPATYVGVAVLLAGTALFACWLPARRATKIEPMVALRYE